MSGALVVRSCLWFGLIHQAPVSVEAIAESRTEGKASSHVAAGTDHLDLKSPHVKVESVDVGISPSEIKQEGDMDQHGDIATRLAACRVGASLSSTVVLMKTAQRKMEEVEIEMKELQNLEISRRKRVKVEYCPPPAPLKGGPGSREAPVTVLDDE